MCTTVYFILKTVNDTDFQTLKNLSLKMDINSNHSITNVKSKILNVN